MRVSIISRGLRVSLNHPIRRYLEFPLTRISLLWMEAV